MTELAPMPPTAYGLWSGLFFGGGAGAGRGAGAGVAAAGGCVGRVAAT